MRIGRMHGLATRLGALALLCAATTAPLAAQRPAAPRDRAQLEQRLQQRVQEIVQRELRLSPDQARRLAVARREFEGQRLPLLQRERQLRRALRGELQAGDSADGKRVDAYLHELLQLQRQRLDVTEREQRALAEFLTPMQRARYLALQENLRDRVEGAGRDGAHRGRGGRPPG